VGGGDGGDVVVVGGGDGGYLVIVEVVMLFWRISGEKRQVSGCVVVDPGVWWRFCGVWWW